MSRKTGIVAFGLVALPIGLWLSCSGVDLDRSVPARPGGELKVALVLGWGLAFDKGSLTVSSHESDEVRVVVDTSGWGDYAVEVEVEAVPRGVRVDGRVDGFLHWLFGGPTVDVQVWVPPDYSVDASIEDGPLLIEDVTGPIVANIDGSELTLRRAEGHVKLVATGGPIVVEDIDGDLELEVGDGDVDVSGVRGDLRIRSRRGRVEVSSVSGHLDVATQSGRIDVEDVRGSAQIKSDNGGIEVEGLEGDLEVETDRGRIEVDDLEGRILARSGRGGIDVHFTSDPAGVIETDRGSIELEVPEDARFDLTASAVRGSVELDSDFDFEHSPAPAGQPQPAESYHELGRQLAAQVSQRVHENLRHGLETGDWDLDWSFDFEQRLGDAQAAERSGVVEAEEQEREQAWGDRGWGVREWKQQRRGGFGGRSVHIVGTVNGGGAPLRLRTARGSIEIDDH